MIDVGDMLERMVFSDPDKIAFTAAGELPQTVGGKTLKYRLRERLGATTQTPATAERPRRSCQTQPH